MFPYIRILHWNISSYGMMMALAYLVAGYGACIRGKKHSALPEDILIVGATVLAGALIGGNLLYCFVTYSSSQLMVMVMKGDFSFLSGGLVFYGGLIGGILGAFLGIKICGSSVQKMERVLIPMIPLGHGIGRIGCLLAGCCHGMKYDGPLAVHYPNSISNLSPDQGYFPVQPLESIVNFMIFFLLLRIERKVSRKYELLLSYLGIYAVSRFFLEFLRGDENRGAFWSISSSQWIAVGCFILVCAYFLAIHNKKLTA